VILSFVFAENKYKISLFHFIYLLFQFKKKTMATLLLIKECLLSLKDRTGSSVIAINRWIMLEKKVSTKNISFD